MTNLLAVEPRTLLTAGATQETAPYERASCKAAMNRICGFRAALPS